MKSNLFYLTITLLFTGIFTETLKKNTRLNYTKKNLQDIIRIEDAERSLKETPNLFHEGNNHSMYGQIRGNTLMGRLPEFSQTIEDDNDIKGFRYKKNIKSIKSNNSKQISKNNFRNLEDEINASSEENVDDEAEGSQENVDDEAEGSQENVDDEAEGSQENVDDEAEGSQENVDDEAEGSQENVDDKAEGSQENVDDEAEGSQENVDDEAEGSQENVDDEAEGSQENVDDQEEVEGSQENVDDQEEVEGSQENVDDQEEVEGSQENVDEDVEENETVETEVMSLPDTFAKKVEGVETNVEVPDINIEQPDINIESPQPTIIQQEQTSTVDENTSQNTDSGPININVDVKMPNTGQDQQPIIIDQNHQGVQVMGTHQHIPQDQGVTGPIVNIHNATHTGNQVPVPNGQTGQPEQTGQTGQPVVVHNPNPTQNWGQIVHNGGHVVHHKPCLLYTSPSPRDGLLSRMPSSA